MMLYPLCEDSLTLFTPIHHALSKKSRNIFLFNVLSGRKSSLPPLQSFLRETFLSGFMAYFILILNLLYIYLLSLGPFCVDCSIKLWIRILIIWEYGKHIHTYNRIWAHVCFRADLGTLICNNENQTWQWKVCYV